MTENELKINGKSFSETISQIEEFMESDDVHGELFTVLRSARDFMENLNEEIQQYRAIGMVEKLSKIKELYDKAKWLLDDERKKRRSYEAIGTIEEFKALKENQCKCEDCAGCTNWKCDCANERAYAIDEFAERLKKKNYDGKLSCFGWHEFIDKEIDKIAEEMKAGTQ